MPEYLFDTNAIQGIGVQTLQAARDAGLRLSLSTISFWELVCHLDDENFQLARGNARKARLFEFLHDPLAEIMADVGCPAAVHAGRFEDQAGARAILDELEGVGSYAELMERRLSLGGRMQRIGELAGEMRNALDEDRERFVSGMRTRCQDYVTRYGRPEAIALNGEEFCQVATGLARTLLEATDQAACNVTFGQLAERTFLGAGYAVARACAYIASVGGGQEIPMDGNDLEDYYICLHLGVSSDRTFVTGDRGVRRALDRTISAFDGLATSHPEAFARNVNIITPDEFRAVFLSRST